MNERIKQLVEAWDNGVRTTAEALISEMRTAIEEAEKQEPSGFFRHEDVCGDEVGPPVPYYLTPPAATRPATREEKIVNPGVYEVPVQNLQCFHCQDTIETLNDKVMHLMAQRPVANPHKWHGLTDEEILSIVYDTKVARAIEAKLREKNTGGTK
jgi:hypothetical protein